VFVNLPPFSGSNPNREDDHDSETRDEGAEHKDIAVVRIGREAEELGSGCQKHNLVEITITIDSRGSS